MSPLGQTWKANPQLEVGPLSSSSRDLISMLAAAATCSPIAFGQSDEIDFPAPCTFIQARATATLLQRNTCPYVQTTRLVIISAI